VALSISIEGKGSIAVCDINAETWGKTGLISAPVDETEMYLQGTEAASTKASNKNGWLYFDIGSGNELDFSASGTEEDELVYVWFQVTTPGSLDTLANKGLAIQIGTTTTDFDYWTIYGSDGNGNGYTGGLLVILVFIYQLQQVLKVRT
jgi:hypothetical protein